MSGTNRLVVSENAMQKGSEEALATALKNANEVAYKATMKKGKKDKKK